MNILAGLLLLALAQDAGTVTFTAGHGGTHPRTLVGDEALTVDLSALPPGFALHRAVLRPGRAENDAFAARDVAPVVTIAGRERPLPLLAPRFSAFDVTLELRAALEAGERSVSFTVASLPGYQRMLNRLEVTGAALPTRAIPKVTKLSARHRNGQTMLTWTEPDPIPRPEAMSVRDWVQARQAHVVMSSTLRYRIYRSLEPLRAATIGKAELVDEIAPLSGWNGDFYGNAPKNEAFVPRYVVLDGALPVPAGTAVYASRPAKAGAAYYAISVSMDGEENLAAFDAGNALETPVEEVVGPGDPVLQRIERPDSFSYVDRPTLRYYVRWEAPPNANLPSKPFDYLVAEPPMKVEPAPVGLHLHCWGGSLEQGFGWWFDAAQGALLISTNQIPYDWWTGYHENRETWKSWRDGVVRDYTQTRLMSFLDWAATQWKIDPQRVFTAGVSMGGSGAPNLALRRAERVAWTVSWVGVQRPARTPQFLSSFEQVYGTIAWSLSFQDRKTTAFDWFDDAAFVRRDLARDLPLVVFSNGKNDKGIGWAQALQFWRALQESKRPHVFRWGQQGHGQRALLPGPELSERELGLDVRLDRTLPAFTRCSLDNDPGDGDPASGDAEGQSNQYLLWDGESAVDQAGKWSMFLKLGPKSPAETCTVDVTPRRCAQFRAPPGSKAKWRTLGLDGGELQAGSVTSDAAGLLTIPGVSVSRSGNRVVVENSP